MIPENGLKKLDELCHLGYDMLETGRGWVLIHEYNLERGLLLGKGKIEEAIERVSAEKISSLIHII
jgi:hypothetical protein